MQQKSLFTLIKGDKISSKTDYRDALPVNMLAIPREILGAQGYMLAYPGLTKVADSPGEDRAGVYNDRFETQYRVSGSKLIKLDPDGTVTNLGTVLGTKQMAMPFSFNTQAIIGEGRYYLYDPVNGFRQVTDPDLGSPIDGCWIDGYYFLTDGEYIYHTDLTDESSINPLKYATAEFMPDKTLGVAKTQDNKVIVFGRNSLEYFVDQATENFAFTRVDTRAQKIGIVATHAKVEVAGSFYITGSRKEESLGVHVIGVGSSVKVSTREVDKILAQYTEEELADMRMEARRQDDVTLVIIHLPNECLYFNLEIAQKFGAGSAWGCLQTGNEGQPYRGINSVFDSDRSQWIVGDKYENQIGMIDHDIFTQYEKKQEWYLYTPFVDLETKSLDQLEIEVIPGNNTVEDATVAVAITRDGQNWGTEQWELYSDPLDYNRRFILYRLGYIDAWIGMRFRGLTTSRMAFAGISLTYG